MKKFQIFQKKFFFSKSGVKPNRIWANFDPLKPVSLNVQYESKNDTMLEKDAKHLLNLKNNHFLINAHQAQCFFLNFSKLSILREKNSNPV